MISQNMRELAHNLLYLDRPYRYYCMHWLFHDEKQEEIRVSFVMNVHNVQEPYQNGRDNDE